MEDVEIHRECLRNHRSRFNSTPATKRNKETPSREALGETSIMRRARAAVMQPHDNVVYAPQVNAEGVPQFGKESRHFKDAMVQLFNIRISADHRPSQSRTT